MPQNAPDSRSPPPGLSMRPGRAALRLPARHGRATLPLAAALAAALALAPRPAVSQGQPGTEGTPPGVESGTALVAEATYTAEWMRVVSGGLRRDGAVLGNLDLTLEITVPGRGLTFFGYLLANHGDEPSGLAGDAQGVSNIEAPEAVRLFEAWAEKEVAGGRLSFLVGLWDLNSEFDVVETGDLFVNSSFGIGPDYSQSGLAGPSIFPVTALALRTRWEPAPSLYLQGAVLDAVPGDPADPTATAVRLSSDEGALLALEAGWRPPVGGGHGSAPTDEPRAKLAAGLWYYTRGFPAAFEGASEGRARPGAYVLAEAPVLRGRDGAGGLSLLARAGWADPRVHRFGGYTGVGAVWTGLLPGRPADRAGVGVATAWSGRRFREALAAEGVEPTRAETVVELTYRWEGGSWAVQPDLQWVVDPDTRASTGDAWLLGVRIETGVALER